MPLKVDLAQLLDIALATPEVGNVNFNVLRGFLHEVLKHLGIGKKGIFIDDIDAFRAAYDLIHDGVSEAMAQTPSELNLIEEHVVRGIESEEALPAEKVDPSLRRTKSASPRISKELIPSAVANIPESATSEEKQISLTVTPASEEKQMSTPDSLPSVESSITSRMSVNKSKRNTPIRGKSHVELTGVMNTIADLQNRIEVLESGAKTTSSLSKVKSTASMFLHSDSKTPAHDMIEVINIGRKLETSENTFQALSEMVDEITSELKSVSEEICKLQELHVLKEMVKQNEETTKKDKEEGKKRAKEMEKKIEDFKNELKTFIENSKNVPSRKSSVDIGNIERIVERKVQHEIKQLAQQLANSKGEDAPPIIMSSEPSKEVYEALDKCYDLEERITYAERRLDNVESREDGQDEEELTPIDRGQPDVSHDTVHNLQHELKGLKKKIDHASRDASQAVSATKRLDAESKQINSLIDENKQQIPQFNNSLILLQREVEGMNLTMQALIAEKEELSQQGRKHSLDGSEDISFIRAMIFDLQEEKESLKHANKSVLDEVYQKQQALDDLYRQLETIQIVKADKDLVTNEIRFKADKKDVELKVERQDFDRYIGLVDQSLRDLLERLEGHENVLREAIDNISGHIKTKLDKTEVEPLKSFLEERLKSFKPKPVEIRPPEDYAAGFRKVLIKNFNCISCDRPVQFAREGMFPPLPGVQAMPGKKSSRPYTTYELDQIRQHMIRGGMEMEQEHFEAIDSRRRRLQSELLKLSGVPNIEDLNDVIDRPCGGSHTLSFPHSRSIIRGLHLNREEFTMETVKSTKNLQNVDIMGQDGHIYKGLVENVPSVLPQIANKPASPCNVAQPVLQEETEKSPCRSTTPTSAKGDTGLMDDGDSS